MKTPLAFLAVLSAALLSTTRYGVVQGGNILSHTLFAPRNHPNNQLNNHPHPNNDPLPPPSTVPHLEWNSELGHNPLNQQSRQGGDRAQEFQPYANFAIQDQQLFGTTVGDEPGCRTRDRVYLPDMQSFLIKVPLTYLEAVQACRACRSELVLIDGTNVDHFREAFTSLGLYGDQRFWIKSWFGEQLERQGFCPAVTVNALMGNRLEFHKELVANAYHITIVMTQNP
ncbi:hypothetical protein BGZ99_008303 [Dissophora globulifera]|uniref:C-type lectin domain-containing protein n=1 Tax=Dissophora globulifera TaxID=979702 RepID=A0A9P6R7B3_9FUNG|nr:hypothetical protein BGZ99_008303 [Dissophora globulifera]